MSIIRQFIKSHTTWALRDAVRRVRQEWQIAGRHRMGLKRAAAFRGRQKLQLHLGSGRNSHTGWVNVDLFSPDADLSLDLRDPLPFDDGSVAVIYSEHFFEHLAYPDQARRFLAECLRVLEPGGRFDVGVPDTEACLTAYVKGDAQVFREAREKWHPAWCNTWMHQVNYHFRQDNEHQYAYDLQTLVQVLTEAGFVNAARRPWNPERDTPGWEDTLYVQAMKPTA